MRSALLVDVQNLFNSIRRKYPGKVLNYVSLLEKLNETGYELFHKVAYGRQPHDKVIPFASMLRQKGFEIHFGNTPHNIEMAVKAVDIINNSNIECLVLGTNYFEVGRILKYGRDKGINTMAFGIGMPEFFNGIADVWELDDGMLIDRKVKETPTE